MNYFVPGLVIGFLLGAVAFGIFALLLLAHRKPPPSITKHARREQTVDVHYTRRYRDAREPGVAPWNKVEAVDDLQRGILNAARDQGNSRFAWQTEQKLNERADGVKYEWINLTGEEQ